MLSNIITVDAYRLLPVTIKILPVQTSLLYYGVIHYEIVKAIWSRYDLIWPTDIRISDLYFAEEMLFVYRMLRLTIMKSVFLNELSLKS